MAVCTRTSLFILTTGMLAALSACGGDDDGTVAVVDAATDAAIDAIPIDAPPVCNAPSMVCGGVCTDVTSSEEYCGNCTTACTGGQVCNAPGTCACAPGFVPAAPTIAFSQMFSMQGITGGFGVFGVTTTNALISTIGATSVENTPYPVSTVITTPPFLGAGYDVDLQNFSAAAAFMASAGTITFTKICASADPNMAGFTAVLTDVTFVAIEGLMNPTPVPDGCTFDVPSLTYSLGNVDCTNQ